MDEAQALEAALSSVDPLELPGDSLRFVAPAAGVKRGRVYRLGHLVVVAADNAPAGSEFSGLIGPGIVHVPKVPSELWEQGANLYYHASTGLVSKNKGSAPTIDEPIAAEQPAAPRAGGADLIGVAAEAAASGNLIGRARLNGISLP